MAGNFPYGFHPAYTISGATPFTLSIGITAAQAWVKGACVARVAAGTISELAADNADVLGAATGDVAAGLSLGPNTEDGGVYVFNSDTVFHTVDAADLTAPTATMLGEIADLDLGAADQWGILQGTSGTGATPQFRIIDIDTVKAYYLVIPAPLEIADVFQWFDAAI